MFRVEGFARDDGRAVSVVWRAPDERGRLSRVPRDLGDRERAPLIGDEKIVNMVEVDAYAHRRYPATPTGPDLVVDLDNPASVLLAIGARIRLS